MLRSIKLSESLPVTSHRVYITTVPNNIHYLSENTKFSTSTKLTINSDRIYIYLVFLSIICL